MNPERWIAGAVFVLAGMGCVSAPEGSPESRAERVSSTLDREQLEEEHSRSRTAERATPLDPAETTDLAATGAGQSIVVCGEAFPIGAPVVLFSDPDGYDARRTRVHFGPVAAADAPQHGDLRYLPGRESREGTTLIEPGSRDLAALREVIDQFVLHYDVCGTSARCFRVLQDIRGLSVHFMLDIDGTLYQTLDLRDQAWHARQANPRSIGIEIANIGAYPPGDTAELERWSRVDAEGLRLVVPEEWRRQVRTPGFVARPDSPRPVRGRIHGAEYEMLDLTPEQYDTLVQLTTALCRIFPEIRPDAPRDRSGAVRLDALSDAEFARYQGILGHYHLTRAKIDPGPAFSWDLYLERVQDRVGRR